MKEGIQELKEISKISMDEAMLNAVIIDLNIIEIESIQNDTIDQLATELLDIRLNVYNRLGWLLTQ